eukprot:scaffold186366_cov20-Tisochrysis_lutea.AAC.2
MQKAAVVQQCCKGLQRYRRLQWCSSAAVVQRAASTGGFFNETLASEPVRKAFLHARPPFGLSNLFFLFFSQRCACRGPGV